MRCIWIKFSFQGSNFAGRLIVTWDVFESTIQVAVGSNPWWLIVTWDVFEYWPSGVMVVSVSRLIVTWDVFEFLLSSKIIQPSLINSNMRCIWICQGNLVFLYRWWLIVTWDVFEWSFLIPVFVNRAINSNMRCIWMRLRSLSRCSALLINSNMRCIWIYHLHTAFPMY